MVAAWNESNHLLYMYVVYIPTCRYCAARTREHFMLIDTPAERIAQDKITKNQVCPLGK
jgi:hypothetical protein